MSNLNAIFEMEHGWQLLDAIRDRVLAKRGATETTDAYLNKLSDGERFVLLATALMWESNNGGLEQFLSNSSGDYTEETRQMLRTIGATAAADALDEVRNTVYAGSPIPRNRSKRCDILFAWQEKNVQQASAFFDGNRQRCRSRLIEDAVVDYIRKHRQEFTDA